VNERPPLTVAAVLAWAEAHRERTGRRPSGKSGPIPEAPGETWAAVDRALTYGYRGLPGGFTLVELLDRHWGPRPRLFRPPLTAEQILAWAEAHRRRTGAWPTASSGEVVGAPEETWRAIDAALTDGLRGLPGGDSLSRFLRRHRRGAT
jgi:hypothetical protein